MPHAAARLKGSGKLYFVPFGDFPTATTEALTTYYQGKYGWRSGRYCR